jgi:hypothetical protein
MNHPSELFPRTLPLQCAKEPRRASILEIMTLLLLALAGWGGAAALLQGFSLREIHLSRRPTEAGASMEVRWLLFGVRVWSEQFPRISDVTEKRLVTRGDYSASDTNPAMQVSVLTVFVDEQKQPAFTAYQSSLVRNVVQMHDYLSRPNGVASELTVSETERWWAANPFTDLAGGAIGLLLSLATGGLFLVGTFSAIRQRLAPRADRAYVPRRIPLGGVSGEAPCL